MLFFAGDLQIKKKALMDAAIKSQRKMDMGRIVRRRFGIPGRRRISEGLAFKIEGSLSMGVCLGMWVPECDGEARGIAAFLNRDSTQ